MKKLYSLLSASMFIALLIGGLTFGTNSALAAGYILQDFDNPSFPPAGWTVQNTTGHDVSRTTYCSGYGTGTSSAVFDFYDYASGYFDIITKTFPATLTL